jgi:hypothetical protein
MDDDESPVTLPTTVVELDADGRLSAPLPAWADPAEVIRFARASAEAARDRRRRLAH